MAALSYIPPPEEMGYYKALFQAADVQQTRNIGGAQAVSFFARSKLPMEVLKNIWTVADQPSTSSLDIKKFAVAVRLIQLTQNGQKGQGPNLAAPPGVQLRPAVFEGVSGVSVPLPQPGGQPPQQQGAPSQPQQQAPPPTPTRAMRPQQSAPPTPGQGLPPQSPTKTSRALTQDPYSLTPHERGRYESLFPQYAKDGYVYGKEAVELFSKSGVNQAVLRDIWNMVDSPVDNRLDKLEFALAMHLIVCISKKNLPIPPNGLPYSLKLLKQEQQPPPQTPAAPTPPPEGGPPAQPSYRPEAQPGGPSQVQPPAEAQMPPGNGIPSPAPQLRGPSPAMNGHQQGNMGIPSNVSSFDQQSAGLPPPVVSTGGVSISDAFEGLSTNSQDVPSSLPAYVPEPSPVASQPAVQSVPPAVEQPPVERKPAPAPVADVVELPKSTQTLASSYDMGDASDELVKLRGVLQRLQAENISLKAQLGSMSEEEKNVQKELSATVAEIGKLSNELTALRAEVIAAKSKLMEASAELKAAREKKGVISDLISEAQETKDAVVEATTSIEKAKDSLPSAPPVENHPQGDMFESNLFGYDPAPAPNANATPYIQAPAPPPVSEPAAAAAPDSFVNESALPDSTVQISNIPPAMAAAPELPQVTTVDSSDIDSAPATSTDQAESFVQAPVEPPIQMFGEASHNRRDSNPFASDLVMGGAPAPLQPPTEAVAPAPSSVSQVGGHGYGDIDPSERHNVEELKTKATLAEETARDAAAAHRKLMAETDELRKDADKAEAHARTLKAQADEKKKGRFGGGKQKKMLREADKAAADAADIRKRFLAVQAQANDAQAVVMETKREVEKLRNEAEQAELDAVQMASLRERQQAQHKAEQEAQAQQSAQSAPLQSAPAANGYPGHGGPPAYSYGKEQMPPPAIAPAADGAPYGGGYGQAPPALDPSQNVYGGFPSYGQEGAGGFGAGVMGGGGDSRFDLPSPDQFPGSNQGESYTNPFST